MTYTLDKGTNRRIGRAMHTYKMLRAQDRVLVAVSGGVDSLVLVWLLDHWRHKAPIDYEITAVHLDMGFNEATGPAVAKQLDRLQVPYLLINTDFGQKASCYHCARQRRNQLFALAAEQKFTKIAFGHHQEDIIETFFLNLFYGGNLSTMVPRQDLFGGSLAIIRPLAFLEKEEIRAIAAALGLEPVANPCPLTGHSKREEIRTLLASLYQNNPRLKANIFAALGNIREGYLLHADRP